MSYPRRGIVHSRRGRQGTDLESTPLRHIVRQLWNPLLEQGAARLVDRRVPLDPAWEQGEQYRVVPSLRHARLLIPDADATTTSAALTNYRGLRTRRTSFQRVALGAAVRLHVPTLRSRVTLQGRVHSPSVAGDELPLRMLARVLGVDELFASIGVRPGANGKVTLQLVERGGAPLGFAKFGWSPATDEYVDNEAMVLGRLAGGHGRIRVPTLLATGNWYGHPFLVSSPLPADALAARSRAALLQVAELADLCPLLDRRPLASTQHLVSVRARIERVAGSPLVAPLIEAALKLLRGVEEHSGVVPVAERWHGDLTPWNTARDGEGRLWCWDWESSEPDAAAGLDALHWMWSVRREEGVSAGGALLRSSLSAASGYLCGLAVPRDSWHSLAALYALTVVERALNLAVEAGGWQTVWIKPQELDDLMTVGTSMLAG